jgi:hypothetical protein
MSAPEITNEVTTMDITIATLAALGAVWALLQLGRPVRRGRDDRQGMPARALAQRRRSRIR